MTDLSDFDGGIDSATTETNETSEATRAQSEEYQHGRCRAIAQNHGRRCQSPAGEDADLCHHHAHDHSPVTIDSGPVDLIEWTSRTLFDDLDQLDVDHDLIRAAVHNLVGLEDEPLTVSEDGLWLPVRHREAGRLIIRSPTATVESYRKGSEPRPPVFPSLTAPHWDQDYLDGEGRTAKIRNEECLPGEDETPKVGLLIEGEGQQWFPLEIVEDGRR